MAILYGFIALNLLIVLAALAVKARRRRRPAGPVKTRATARSAGGRVSRQWTVQNDILGIGTACDSLRDFLESQEVQIKRSEERR